MKKQMIFTYYNADGTIAKIQFIPEEEFSTGNLEKQLAETTHEHEPKGYNGGLCTVVEGWIIERTVECH